MTKIWRLPSQGSWDNAIITNHMCFDPTKENRDTHHIRDRYKEATSLHPAAKVLSAQTIVAFYR